MYAVGINMSLSTEKTARVRMHSYLQFNGQHEERGREGERGACVSGVCMRVRLYSDCVMEKTARCDKRLARKGKRMRATCGLNRLLSPYSIAIGATLRVTNESVSCTIVQTFGNMDLQCYDAINETKGMVSECTRARRIMS
jgi:hypothetical protein